MTGEFYCLNTIFLLDLIFQQINHISVPPSNHCHHKYIAIVVNDVIADKNVVTKIMNKSTGFQRIELNGFAKRHLANWLLPL